MRNLKQTGLEHGTSPERHRNTLCVVSQQRIFSLLLSIEALKLNKRLTRLDLCKTQLRGHQQSSSRPSEVQSSDVGRFRCRGAHRNHSEGPLPQSTGGNRHTCNHLTICHREQKLISCVPHLLSRPEWRWLSPPIQPRGARPGSRIRNGREKFGNGPEKGEKAKRFSPNGPGRSGQRGARPAHLRRIGDFPPQPEQVSLGGLTG